MLYLIWMVDTRSVCVLKLKKKIFSNSDTYNIYVRQVTIVSFFITNNDKTFSFKKNLKISRNKVNKISNTEWQKERKKNELIHFWSTWRNVEKNIPARFAVFIYDPASFCLWHHVLFSWLLSVFVFVCYVYSRVCVSYFWHFAVASHLMHLSINLILTIRTFYYFFHAFIVFKILRIYYLFNNVIQI